jgi:hypothetical protein
MVMSGIAFTVITFSRHPSLVIARPHQSFAGEKWGKDKKMAG